MEQPKEMTKSEFNAVCLSQGMVLDGEYAGVFHLPGTSIYTWWCSEEGMAISWDLEYTVYRKATTERLINLVELFSRD